MALLRKSISWSVQGALALLILLLSLTLAGPAQASPSAPTDVSGDRWNAANIGAPALQGCFDLARATAAEAWTCTPDGLTVIDQATGESTFTALSAAGAAPQSDVSIAAAEPDPDTWCESGSICSTRVSAYIAWTKGNVGYGNSSGAIGAWDNTIRVNLNGRQPQYRLVAVHDTGPALSLKLTLTCNETPFPYAQCGYSERSASISASSRKYESGFIYGDALSDATSYRATVGGTFTASGYSYTFTIGALRSLIWNCPSSGNCTFP